MMFGKANKNKTKKTEDIAQQYFSEATAWDTNVGERIKQSERTAWMVAGAAIVMAILGGISIVALMPLKTVEPFVIRVDNATGLTDVVSILKEDNIEATDAMNKYWLSQYIHHRESYLWDTREYDRIIVGLMSAPAIQEQYLEYTEPRNNENAPIVIYGENTEVNTTIKSISMLNTGENLNGEHRYTASVRYTKEVERVGSYTPTTHWVATIVFAFRNTPMNVNDRLLNPMGFQVLSYRNDEESEVQS